MSSLEDLIWQRASEVLFIEKEQYIEQLRTYQVEAVERDGALLGAVMRKGPEFHFVTFGNAARIDRQTVRAVLEPQLAEYGYVLTRTPKPDTGRQHRFNRTMGFVAVGEDEYNIHYRLDRGRSAVNRRATCP